MCALHKDLSIIQSMRYTMKDLHIKGVMMNIGGLCNRDTFIIQKDGIIVNWTLLQRTAIEVDV